MQDLPGLDDECFVIAPIGDDGSPERERSDGVFEYIVSPAAQDLGLTAVRADRIGQPGIITRQVIEHVVLARAAVVDLTGANPNVYYEMAVRHTAKLPTVLIAQKGESLPFDIQQMRTIFFDHQSLKSAAECKAEISRHLKEALDGAVDSPVSSSVTLQTLEQGNPQEQVLANLVATVEDLGREIRSTRLRAGRGIDSGVHPQAIHDLSDAIGEILLLSREIDDPRLKSVVDLIATAGRHITRNLKPEMIHSDSRDELRPVVLRDREAEVKWEQVRPVAVSEPVAKEAEPIRRSPQTRKKSQIEDQSTKGTARTRTSPPRNA